MQRTLLFLPQQTWPGDLHLLMHVSHCPPHRPWHATGPQQTKGACGGLAPGQPLSSSASAKGALASSTCEATSGAASFSANVSVGTSSQATPTKRGQCTTRAERVSSERARERKTSAVARDHWHEGKGGTADGRSMRAGDPIDADDGGGDPGEAACCGDRPFDHGTTPG
jgi:hypothetical protein